MIKFSFLSILFLLVLVSNIVATPMDKSIYWDNEEYKNFKLFPQEIQFKQLSKNKQYQQALSVLNKIIDLDKENIKNYKLKRDLLLILKDSTKTITQKEVEEFSLSLKDSFPKSYIGYSFVFEDLIKENKFAEILSLGQQVLLCKDFPKELQSSLIDKQITSFKKSGNYLKDLRKYRTIYKLSKRDYNLYKNYITSLLYLKNFDEAIEVFRNFKKSDFPIKQTDLHFWIKILCHFNMNLMAEEFASSLDFLDDNIALKVQILANQQKYQLAGDLLYSLKSSKQKDEEFWMELSRFYHKSQNISKELAIIEEGIKVVEDDFRLYQILSERLIEMKLSKKAINYLSKQKYSDYKINQIRLMISYSNEYSKAIKRAKEFIQKSYTKEKYIPYLRTLVVELSRHQNWQSPKKLFSYVMTDVFFLDSIGHGGFFNTKSTTKKISMLRKKFPFNETPQLYRFEFLYNLYSLYNQTNDIKNRDIVITEMMEIEVITPEDMIRIANACYKDGNFEKTTYILHKYLEQYNENTQVNLLFAHSYNNLKKRGLAIHYFAKALQESSQKSVTSDIATNLLYLYDEIEMYKESVEMWGYISKDNTNISNILGAQIALKGNDYESFKKLMNNINPSTMNTEDKVEYYNTYSKYYETTAQKDSVIYYKTKITEISPSTESFLSLGKKAEKYEDYFLANSSYYEAYKQDISVDLNLTFSNLFYKMNWNERAFKGYKKELTNNLLDDNEINKKLVDISLKTGRYKFANLKMKDLINYHKSYSNIKEPSIIFEIDSLKKVKREVTKNWNITVDEKINIFDENQKVNPLIDAGNNGFLSVVGKYYPSYKHYIPLKSLAVGLRAVCTNDNAKPNINTTQLGINLEYKPFINIPVSVLAEYSFGVGEDAVNTGFFNINNKLFDDIDRRILTNQYFYKSIENNISFLTDNAILYGITKIEAGFVKQFNKAFDFSIAPYVIAGGNLNTDRADNFGHLIYGGVGFSILSWHNENALYSHSIKNRLTGEVLMEQSDLKSNDLKIIVQYKGSF